MSTEIPLINEEAAAFVTRLVGITQRTAAGSCSTMSRRYPVGRMVGPIGPDGVGKSSLLAIIAGARRVQAGNVQVL